MRFFEWDEAKSRSNALKHGISFHESVVIWSDPQMIRLKSLLIGEFETRYLVIGSVNGKIWTAIITMRNEKIRIISVRRSRKNEEKLYYAT